MLQIRRTNIVNDDGCLDRLRDEFRERKSVVLPEFVQPGLLDELMLVIDKAIFVPKIEGGEGDEFGQVLHVPPGHSALFVFHLLLNRPNLFDIVRYLTDCQSIGNFFGRIHRSAPRSDHHIEWHGDNADHRLVGISINLSRESYSGGAFQIREKESKVIKNEIRETRLGDAFLFGISPDLQHRLLPVEAGGNRTVGVGWFRSLPDWPTFSKDFFLSPSTISRGLKL